MQSLSLDQKVFMPSLRSPAAIRRPSLCQSSWTTCTLPLDRFALPSATKRQPRSTMSERLLSQVRCRCFATMPSARIAPCDDQILPRRVRLMPAYCRPDLPQHNIAQSYRSGSAAEKSQYTQSMLGWVGAVVRRDICMTHTFFEATDKKCIGHTSIALHLCNLQKRLSDGLF